MFRFLPFPRAIFRKLLSDFKGFSSFLGFYLHKKIIKYVAIFENSKNSLVKLFTIKRGRYNRLFLHLSTMGVLALGVIIAPFLASTYPVFSAKGKQVNITFTQAKQSITVNDNVFQTNISQKPRDKIIDYTVQKGDTVSTIAKKYGISENTIRWENDLSNDNLSVGDSLKILPVTGIAHKVENGDTVYSIAKKYGSDPQQIVDFPFNEFANPETFSLVEGQQIIVPDGVKPEENQVAPIRKLYIASGPVAVAPGGLTWPLSGGISQYASWYHMALDITDPIGTPIFSAENGTVSYVSVGSWDSGYGTNVWVENGNGTATHYAHMSAVNVSVGQSVSIGKSMIGWVGMTGRTTGPHLHFEVRKDGVLVNPLSFLQ